MKEKYSIKGTYEGPDGKEKEFTIDFENSILKTENSQQLMEMLEQPWQLILGGGKFGVNGIKRFFGIFFLFACSNTLVFFYALFQFFSSDVPSLNKGLFVLLVGIVGVGVTLYSTYLTYQYIVIDTVRVIYENLASLFQKISALIIDKVEGLFQGKGDFSDQQLSKALDISGMVNDKFQSLPRFVRKGMILVLGKIPFIGMLMDLKEDISNGNKADASSKLYNKMDAFISESIFGLNNTNWVFWMLPLNIIVLLILIQLNIST